MNQAKQSTEFEELFDRAVSSYAPPEPRPGLEHRILAHLEAHAATQTPPRFGEWLRRPRWLLRRPHWLWITSGLATATVAASLVLVMIPSNCVSRSDADRFARRQPPAIAHRAAPPGAPLQARIASPASKPHRLSPHTFGTEVTPQEHLLSQFAAQHPEAALNLAKITASVNQPISVAPLNPEPIHPEPIRLEALSVRPIHIEPIDLTVQQPPSF